MKTILTNIVEPSDLTIEQIEAIKTYIKKNQPTIYWDYRDSLNKEQIEIILNGDTENEISNIIFDNNIDYIYDLEVETITNAVNHVTGENTVNKDNENDFRDEFLDYLGVDMNMEQLIRNTDNGKVNVQVRLYSNYDCINSHWFENQNGYSYIDSYFGDMVNLLNLNPSLLKKEMIKQGFKCVGSYPNKKNRDGKELVDYSKFCSEIQGTTCGCNLFTFIGQINLHERYDNCDEFKTITLPKGCFCGLFSGDNGGGSMFDLTLNKSLVIDLKKFGKTQYNKISIVSDSENNGYTMKDCYGVSNNFFKSDIDFTTISK